VLFIFPQPSSKSFAHIVVINNDLIPDSKEVDDSANFPNPELENGPVIQAPGRESSCSSFFGNFMRSGEVTWFFLGIPLSSLNVWLFKTWLLCRRVACLYTFAPKLDFLDLTFGSCSIET
jgi:hypothetical protein